LSLVYSRLALLAVLLVLVGDAHWLRLLYQTSVAL
jgi:hypothetical protein